MQGYPFESVDCFIKFMCVTLEMIVHTDNRCAHRSIEKRKGYVKIFVSHSVQCIAMFEIKELVVPKICGHARYLGQ